MSSIISSIYANWDLDAWSIGKDLFLKITEVLPPGSTILEFGSGAGTGKLANIYKMISIEENKEFMNKFKSHYLYVPSVPIPMYSYPKFPEDPVWYDPKILDEQLKLVEGYDCILIDGPKGWRGGFYYNRHLFNLSKLMIFDDIHAEQHFRLMDLISKEVGRPYIVYNDGNKQFGIIPPKTD
jgi:hypothetical protein